jgi:hypothetical protein
MTRQKRLQKNDEYYYSPTQAFPEEEDDRGCNHHQ